MNRPLVERGEEREKRFPFPFLAVFSPKQRACSQASVGANPSRVMIKKPFEKEVLDG